jgi:hypothetical protein
MMTGNEFELLGRATAALEKIAGHLEQIYHKPYPGAVDLRRCGDAIELLTHQQKRTSDVLLQMEPHLAGIGTLMQHLVGIDALLHHLVQMKLADPEIAADMANAEIVAQMKREHEGR